MNNVYENTPNPFDPEWYKLAFDQSISTANILLNQQNIINDGYTVPDKDGSISSIIRNETTLNGSFDENVLHETLWDIYNNTSHKLKASNHDNTGFFKWNGTFNDINIVENTKMAEFSIPVDEFITPDERDRYKTTQFFRNWISIQDILNNWDVFKFHILLFIQGRIYSEYEIRMDDQEISIRFKFQPQWSYNNASISIYKFTTNYQRRIFITRELCMNQWNWKLPISFIKDDKIYGQSKVVACFNKIQNDIIRKDNKTNIDILGDNLEFLTIEDGYIDLSNISKFNRVLIESEGTDYIWLSLFVPKSLHEYPILLPLDSIYSPYVPNMKPIFTSEDGIKKLLVDDNNQLYADIGNKPQEVVGWNELIRPVVLSDAFEMSYVEPYQDLIPDANAMKDLTVHLADLVEQFSLGINGKILGDFNLYQSFITIKNTVNEIREFHNNILHKRMIDKDAEYETWYAKFIEASDDIISNNIESKYLDLTREEESVFDILSPLVYIPSYLANRFRSLQIIKEMNKTILWEDTEYYQNRIRFQRPVDCTDFWIFKYDCESRAWRPIDVSISHKIPDVYLISENNQKIGDIYKAFFFYSDTMDVLHESSEIIRPTAIWEEQSVPAVYKDIFLDRFYWMAIKSIYSGLLYTNCRWEILEYVMNNKTYDRFNKLFLGTMEPYFKLGMDTYLKSNNFNFIFDEELSKMQESINLNWNQYKRINNFEKYLNNQWSPSYFDFNTTISNTWYYQDYLIRRPTSTFDMRKLKEVVAKVHINVSNGTYDVADDMSYVLSLIEDESYNLNTISINTLYENIKLMPHFTNNINNIINGLDIYIYSLNDLGKIIDEINLYINNIDTIHPLLDDIKNDINAKILYDVKEKSINKLINLSLDINQIISSIIENINLFDIEYFMDKLNDLAGYIRYDKFNPDDESLIGKVNEFNNDWTVDVKEKRNKLYISTTTLYSLYAKDKKYSMSEILNFLELVKETNLDIKAFKYSIERFYTLIQQPTDNSIIDILDYSITSTASFGTMLEVYQNLLSNLNSVVNEFYNEFDKLNVIYNSKYDILSMENIKTAINILLSEISKFATNTDTNIRSEYTELTNHLNKWLEYNNIEKNVFDILTDVVISPNPMMIVLLSNKEILNALLQYVDIVMREYIPNRFVSNYKNIYEIDTIEITNPGFWYKNDDIIYVPKMGVYKITETDGDINIATSISKLDYRASTYINPLEQIQPFHATSTGDGMGITIKPVSVITTPIINDNLLDDIIIRINSILKSITNCISKINPYNNKELNSLIYSMDTIINLWDAIKVDRIQYIHDNIIHQINIVCEKLYTLKDACKILINTRSLININYLLSEYKSIIDNAEQWREPTSENLIYINAVKDMYSEFKNFYGNYGTRWDGKNELTELLDLTLNSLNVCRDNILYGVNSGEELSTLKTRIRNLIEFINSIKTTLRGIDVYQNDVINAINHLIESYQDIPKNLSKDAYYKIYKTNIANPGTGYVSGDIIKLIPIIPKNFDIDDNMKDIIINDSIFFQIMEVDNDQVMKVSPLLEYATKYPLFGLYTTETMTGKGRSLTIDIISKNIDNSKFNTDINQFDDNDLVKFTFDNTHDTVIDYEVYVGGNQINNFFLRHQDLNGNKVDNVYINANDVYNLRNSVIVTPEKHSFVYRIDDIKIKDKGSGYSLNQNIYVAVNGSLIKLKVTKLTDDNIKGIEDVELVSYTNSYSKDVYADNVTVIEDSINNIDDEFSNSYYDKLSIDGIVKPATFTYSNLFVSNRYDKLEVTDRNATFMQPRIDPNNFGIKKLGGDSSYSEYYFTDGDPDENIFLGTRIDNSYSNDINLHIWEGIHAIIPPTDPFIDESCRIPGDFNNDYIRFGRIRLHNTSIDDDDLCNINPDKTVMTFSTLPRMTSEWDECSIGKIVIVESDETHDFHRMMYIVKTFWINGKIIYKEPLLADKAWNIMSTNWSDINKYIHEVSTNDICIFNNTLRQWEDLNAEDSRWSLERTDSGFELIYSLEGYYSYDFIFFLNKNKDNQIRNSALKRNATLDIVTSISKEVYEPSETNLVYTGRRLTIRKSFPFYQKESYSLGTDNDGNHLGYEMHFKVNNYQHFRNKLHLEDITIFNKSAYRFENIFDESLFEVRFKDDKSVDRGKEIQTTIVNSYISDAGNGYVNGNVWGYNETTGTHIFGRITTDYTGTGYILTFTPSHCPNPPKDNIVLDFKLVQYETQPQSQLATVLVEFNTKEVDVFGDGYIHNVTNPMAVIPEEFIILIKYGITTKYDYDIIIDKRPNEWKFNLPTWEIIPKFKLYDVFVPSDRIYIITDKGRFPLVNPSTGLPTIACEYTSTGTDISFLNIYRNYENIIVKTTPYSMRSVFTLRNIPENGYIDLNGKINKPLSKKYFEFWVNGKLLDEQVSIITPTKLVLHGLTSLHNLEIIEIDRDSNEYFSDLFLTLSDNAYGNKFRYWDYTTYLDDVLDCKLSDNYTSKEQATLLYPILPQVTSTDEQFKNYPTNCDIDDDILVRMYVPGDLPIEGLTFAPYQYMILDTPKIEVTSINKRNMKWDEFGFKPISDSDIISILDSIWKSEIDNNSYFPKHNIISNNEWYGVTIKMYDGFGNEVTSLSDSIYCVFDDHIINISRSENIVKLIDTSIEYDLS